MAPTDVILEILDDKWSVEGDFLVAEDSEGCFTRAAWIISKGEGYPVQVIFLEGDLPTITARDEPALREALEGLSKLSVFRRRFSPLP